MSKDVSKDKYITGIFAEPQATATSNVVWMRSSESYFLLAEYALRWGTNERLGRSMQPHFQEMQDSISYVSFFLKIK